MNSLARLLLVVSCLGALVSIVTLLLIESTTGRTLAVVAIVVWVAFAATIWRRPDFVVRK